MSTTPHDAFFKAVFINPEHAGAALRTLVPPAIARSLDWTTLAYTDGAFIDDAMRYGFTDLLFTARWRSAEASSVYLVFEHQSSVDNSMAFRLVRYLVRIWERWRNERRRASETHALPLVVPVVLYHGDSGWSAPTSLCDLLDVPDDVRAALAPHGIDPTYVVEDLSRTPDAELCDRAMPALSTVAMLCLKYARSHDDLFERLHRWGALLRRVVLAPNGREAIAHVMGYILRVHNPDINALYEFAERELGPETKEITMTTADRLIEQGEQKGRQEGLQRGRQERALILRLSKRFGEAVDDEIVQRIEQASPAQLTRWLERSDDVATLRDALSD